MKINLSSEEQRVLELQHSKEKDRRKADRIKSILLRHENWSLGKIAQALRIHNDTVSRYISDYLNNGSLDFNYQGSNEKLSPEQSEELIQHLEANLYRKVMEIVAYVKTTYKVTYSVSGMTDWLRKHKFSYKSPKGSPSKTDIEKQREFIEIYEQLKDFAGKNDEPILFLDGVHPSMQTKLAYGWIRQGKEKQVSTIASRTRMNIMGAINLDSMQVVTKEYEKTINGKSVINFLDAIKARYYQQSVIHLILDQAGYNKAFEVREYASKLGTHLHYLPPYSPNLNSIERLWKVMNEEARNNVCFNTAKEFKTKIRWFFDERLPKISENLRTRINDNFHVYMPKTDS